MGPRPVVQKAHTCKTRARGPMLRSGSHNNLELDDCRTRRECTKSDFYETIFPESPDLVASHLSGDLFLLNVLICRQSGCDILEHRTQGTSVSRRRTDLLQLVVDSTSRHVVLNLQLVPDISRLLNCMFPKRFLSGLQPRIKFLRFVRKIARQLMGNPFEGLTQRVIITTQTPCLLYTSDAADE